MARVSGKKNTMSLFQRAITSGGEWETEDLTKVVYWFKQIFSLLCGVVWGLIPLLGAVGNIGYGVTLVVACIFYISNFLGVDEDDHGGRWKLLQEGTMSAYAFFLLAWILTYSLVQFN